MEQTETWPTATANHYRTYSPFLPWDHRKGAAEGKGCIRRSFCHSFLNASAFRSVPVALLPLCFSISLLSLPYHSPFLFFPWSLFFPPFFLSPVLFISLPQHPVPYLWCVLVLAKARPGRTGGYLVRQQSPWAPTPFPPPGAAQVSRWKVRGERWGRQP